MRPMLYKELLSARPQLIIVLLIGGTLLLDELIGVDPLQGLAGMLTTGIEGVVLLLGGLAFALGHAQIGPEITHKHIELLDGLPLTRIEVYLTKLLAGLSVIGLLIAVTITVIATVTQLTWGALAPETLATVMGALAAAIFACYGTGLLLSWLGGFGWAVLGVGFLFLQTFAEVFEELRPLSLFHGYGAVRFEANTPLLLVWPSMFWVAYGAVCIALSGLIFVLRGDRLVAAGSGLAQAAKLLMLFAVGGLLLLLALVAMVRLAARGGESIGAPTLVKAGTYRVLVPKDETETSRVLVEQIPDIDAEVRAVMGVQDPLHLDVELVGGGRYHAGVYTGGKIRMRAGGEAVNVFAHEVAHAYAHVLAKGGIQQHHNSIRFFSEGLAMWAAEKATSTHEETDQHRAWAAALYQMDHEPLDLLMDDQARALTYDPFEPYPLGLVFVEALVDVSGPSAVPCLLKEAGRLPNQKIAGPALWSRLFEGCKVDPGALVAAYKRILAAYAEKYPLKFRPAVGHPVWTADGLKLNLTPMYGDPKAPVEGKRRCRFRTRLEATPADLEESLVEDDGQCQVKSIISATNTVSFQVGVELPTGWVAYTQWIEHPVPPRTGQW